MAFFVGGVGGLGFLGLHGKHHAMLQHRFFDRGLRGWGFGGRGVRLRAQD